MSPNYESLLSDALHLPPKEREMLAEQLELSVLGLSETELIKAWAALSDKRFREYKEGNASVYEVNDVIREARDRS
ncbi:MAG: addiction module protein [Bacteroidota bacterium]